MDELEDELFEWLVDLFVGQERRILQAARETPEELLSLLTAFRADERNIFHNQSVDIYPQMVENAATEALERLSLIGFDVTNPDVQAFLDRKAFTFADEVTATTTAQLRSEFTEALAAGENIDQITERVRGVFDGTTRGDAPRARLIARTESASIVNGGALLGYQQHDDIIDGKEWVASQDNRTRASHTAAHGQIRELNATFNVGGAALMQPGDPNAPIEEIANCRCSIAPILTE